MKIAVGSDKRTKTTGVIVKLLKSHGHKVSLSGALLKPTNTDWVGMAEKVAIAVKKKKVEEAIVFCWSGTGVAMVASKIPGIRAVTVSEPKIAKWARAWDHANVLAMSCFLPAKRAKKIAEVWLKTPYSKEPDDIAAIKKIAKLERRVFRRG